MGRRSITRQMRQIESAHRAAAYPRREPRRSWGEQWSWGNTGLALREIWALLDDPLARIELPHWAVESTMGQKGSVTPGYVRRTDHADWYMMRCGCRLFKIYNDHLGCERPVACLDDCCPIGFAWSSYRGVPGKSPVFVITVQQKPREIA